MVCDPQMAGDGQLIRDDKRDSERRVPNPYSQAYYRSQPQQIAVCPGQPWQWHVAYRVSRPVGRKVGLPHQIVSGTRIDGDSVRLERVLLSGNRAHYTVDLRRHQANDALYDLRGDHVGQIISRSAPASSLAPPSRSSSLTIGAQCLSFLLRILPPWVQRGAHAFRTHSFLTRGLLGAHVAFFFLQRALAVPGAFAADPRHPTSGGREIFAFVESYRAHGSRGNFSFDK